MFHKMENTASGIERLLNAVDAADKSSQYGAEDADDTANESGAPSIEDFLAEEDITRECRGDNKRLIAYLCRPEIVAALVDFCVYPNPRSHARMQSTAATPSHASGSNTDATGLGSSQVGEKVGTESLTSSGTMRQVDNLSVTEEDAAIKKRYTRSYIASELLSADVRPLADAVVGNGNIIDSLLSCLENSESGDLHTYAGIHFAKVISSLLKTRNSETLKQLSDRGSTFVSGLLKHLPLPSIADLIVRILDGPDVDRGYSTVLVRPPEPALSLLVSQDILNGLADRFVECSVPKPSNTPETSNQRRIREETMCHATNAIQGIVTRILQLPALGVRIPTRLNPYGTPGVIMRMLKAGLSAYDSCGSHSDQSLSKSAASSTSGPTWSGSSVALLHSLRLAAFLMTTEANIVRDDSDSIIGTNIAGPAGGMGPGMHGVSRQSMFGIGRGRPGMGFGIGRGGGGIAASVHRQQEEQRLSQSGFNAEGGAISTDAAPQEPIELPEIGAPIESTLPLEKELVALFERLAQMFGSISSDEADGRPLGSLRLTLAEFYVACMNKSSQDTVNVIVRLGVPKKLTSLFLTYEWSSMLHGVITRSIVSAFAGEPSGGPARKAWLHAQVIPWMIKAWELNDKKAKEEEIRFRAGYMGHLIQIGHTLVQYTQEYEDEIRQCGMVSESDLKAFRNFAERHLAPAYNLESTPLGGEGLPGQNAGTSDVEDISVESTDVFDMAEVVEGLSQSGDPNAAISTISRYIRHRSEDEEEVVPLDVSGAEGDLSHFGPDDDEDVEATVVQTNLIDHDIPLAFRNQDISSFEPDENTFHNLLSGDRGSRSVSNEKQNIHFVYHPTNIPQDNGFDPRPRSADAVEDHAMNDSLVDASSSFRLSKAEDFEDSSDEEGGTYHEFVECSTDSENVVPASTGQSPMPSEKHGQTDAVTSIPAVAGRNDPVVASLSADIEAQLNIAPHRSTRDQKVLGVIGEFPVGGPPTNVVIPEDEDDGSSEDDEEGWTKFSELPAKINSHSEDKSSSK